MSCENLITVTFAEGSQLENIDEDAFKGCTSLVSITIPEDVAYIGFSAFFDCTSLTTVTVLAETPPWMGDFTFYVDDGILRINPSLEAIRVPAGSGNDYRTALSWSNYAHLIVEIP
jgi:hypothetical protein